MNELEVNGKTNDIYTFDFSEMEEKAEEAQELDNDFCDNADEAVAHAKKALRSFKRLHDLMANHYQGTWRRWLGFRNITKDEAARMLRKYEYVVANGDNADYILQLAESKKRLVDEAARPSTPQELKDGVANGDITTLPQFKKLKAELEATKNVLRTTESKLTSAEQERDEAKTENVQLKANFSTAVSDKAFEIQGESVRAKKAAEQARDEAEAKAESFRAKADAYDDLQKTNHSLREKIRQQADELANRPNVETVVTKEVIPDEYKKALLENQQLKKELAAHRAHAQNMTVQELAQTDKEFDDLQKSYEEEERTSKRLEYFETLSSFFPEGQIEARELARCFLKFHGNEPAIVHTVQQNLRLAIDSMTWIYDALTAKPKLEVVK